MLRNWYRPVLVDISELRPLVVVQKTNDDSRYSLSAGHSENTRFETFPLFVTIENWADGWTI